jgi:hypothetical protein
MKRLVALGLLLIVAACAQQESPPPAATAPPPPMAAAPPPPMAPAPPPPPPTLASYNGRYAGQATNGPSGVETEGTTNPVCVDNRPMNMSIKNGYVTIWYRDWKHHLLHYRGRIDAAGKIYSSHLNGDGSRSVFSMQMNGDSASGDMQRGNCSYQVTMSRAASG